MPKKETIKEMIDKIWPKTKKELEKGVENAKKMLARGEEYLKDLSEKGLEKTKKISLSLQKEKMYYTLGKAAASTAMTKWRTSKKITSAVKKIKEINVQIKNIK